MKTFIEATEDYLQIADKPKTVREIYSKIKDEIGEHPGDPYVTLSGILVQQVKKSNSKIIVVDYNKPKTLWLKSRIPELENLGIRLETSEEISYNSDCEKDEKDLYPLLIEILREENAIYSKRIDEKITEKGTKGLNKWINPDIVGVKYFFEEHSDDVNELIENSSSPLYELYSYEVKKEIKLANIKECYFQAVSNSSWANYGYLACLEFNEENEELYNEVNRLVESFGIGLIKLNVDKNKQKSGYRIIFPAKLNTDLDYSTIENLCRKNDDFRCYINKINKSVKIKDVQEF